MNRQIASKNHFFVTMGAEGTKICQHFETEFSMMTVISHIHYTYEGGKGENKS
jgi:hypothetical protein